jgi:hypothetical protein
MTDFERYIRENYEKTDYLAVNRLVRGERVAMRQQVLPATEVASESYQRFLRGQNAHGNDVYLGVNAYKPDSHGR